MSCDEKHKRKDDEFEIQDIVVRKETSEASQELKMKDNIMRRRYVECRLHFFFTSLLRYFMHASSVTHKLKDPFSQPNPHRAEQ